MSKHLKRDARRGSSARRSRDDGSDPEAVGHRHERLTRILREEIAAVMRDELRDARLDGISITEVELSVDYKNARVGFVSPARAGATRVDRERLERLLERAAPFMRARLCEALDLKQAPALRFAWDAYAAAAPVSEMEG